MLGTNKVVVVVVVVKSRGWVDGNNPTNASQTDTGRVRPSRG